MEQIVYVIPGDPVPLQRPRHHINKVYDSQKNLKLVIGINLSNQHGNKPLYTCPLLLNVTFYMPVAASRDKQKSRLLGTPHFYKPDLDNLLKMVCDCANSILYRDDSQIVLTIARKIYGEPARTEFSLCPFKESSSKNFSPMNNHKIFLQKIMEMLIND
jgi:Holliday junction resolvase RusA-like endonuclease